MINILIVDDMQILRECLKLTIENNKQFKVVGCASNGKEAVEMSLKLSPDIILMDLNMPLYSGHDAIKKIKETDKSVKIIVLTVEDNEQNMNIAFKNGADGYIIKDIGFYELSAVIKNIYEGNHYINEKSFFAGSNFILNDLHKNPLEKEIKKFDLNINFTVREKEVLKLVIQGMTNEEISKVLDISVGRARNIITTLISKCMVKNRTQLAVFYLNSSFIV